MAPPENERGRPTTGAPRKLAAKLASEDQSTAILLAVDGSGVEVLDRDLAELLGGLPASHLSPQAVLGDTERVALALVDTYGPTWARRLAGELLAAADDICPPRTPWPGGGRS